MPRPDYASMSSLAHERNEHLMWHAQFEVNILATKLEGENYETVHPCPRAIISEIGILPSLRLRTDDKKNRKVGVTPYGSNLEGNEGRILRREQIHADFPAVNADRDFIDDRRKDCREVRES